MKYLSFVSSSAKYRDVRTPPAMAKATGELIDKFTNEGALVDTGGLAYWPEFEGECEVRPIEFQARG